MRVGDSGIEFDPKPGAVALNVALRRSTPSSMLPALEALGQPKELEVVAPSHVG
jgi:hypothetical protein